MITMLWVLFAFFIACAVVAAGALVAVCFCKWLQRDSRRIYDHAEQAKLLNTSPRPVGKSGHRPDATEREGGQGCWTRWQVENILKRSQPKARACGVPATGRTLQGGPHAN